LENTLFLSIAVFFFMTGRGRISIDRLILPKLDPPAWLARDAVIPLRIGMGVSLVVVAFTEKLANQPLALDFLRVHPLNFTAALGLPISDEMFVLAAGSVELLIGLFILLGIFNREIVIVALLPLNLTLSVSNQTELIGHLPFYGIMALLLVWDAGSENRREWLDGVCGTRRAASVREARTGGTVDATSAPKPIRASPALDVIRERQRD
jgi:uncharacterized membrane protein YphA (DoxX/SURF4 family)